MEYEIGTLDEKIETLSEKLALYKGEPFYENLYEDFKCMSDNLKGVIKYHDINQTFGEIGLSKLTDIQKTCERYEDEIADMIPDWSLPHHPVIDEESQKDFLKFQEWLYEYVQFLTGLKEAHPQALKKFTDRIYDLKKDLEIATHMVRADYRSEKMWKTCIELRGQIQEFESKFNNLTERLKVGT